MALEGETGYKGRNGSRTRTEVTMASRLEGRRILVVDDEPDIGALVQTLLRKATVELAYTYEDAKRRLSSSSYDAVILDIMGVDGHTLLREFGAKAPCIMLTAHAISPEDLRKSVQGNAVLYLPKDELSKLEGYIAKVLETPRDASLWRWLLGKVDFRKHFGQDWLSGCSDLFEGVTTEEIVKDLEWRGGD
jgi:CheY-like chemotaxis protein